MHRHTFVNGRASRISRGSPTPYKRLSDRGLYEGAIWLEGSPSVEETVYWLNLLIDTEIPIVGNAAQRPHGALSADGDRNIVARWTTSTRARGPTRMGATTSARS